ncbi:MAG: signal peptidase I [Planctomycetaceae bacterium]|nr:signal peptidase I [Planctomycetaceae bacterium]
MPVVIIATLGLMILVVDPLLLFAAARLVRVGGATIGRAYKAFLAIFAANVVAMFFTLKFLKDNDVALNLIAAIALFVGSAKLAALIFQTGFWRATAAYFIASVLVIGLAFGMRWTLIESFAVPTGGMAPTIQCGDRMMTDKLTLALRAPRAGDIVVFAAPVAQLGTQVKRVIAIEGDKVDIQDGNVLVNGQSQGACPLFKNDQFPPQQFPLIVPAGKLFVLGDNRAASLDSRYWGCVNVNAVRALAGIVYASAVPRSPEFTPLSASPNPTEKPGTIRWSRIGTILK